MKRFLIAGMFLVAILVFSMVLLARRPRADVPASTVQAADTPLPSYFRNNQPRHWRYAMLSQTK